MTSTFTKTLAPGRPLHARHPGGHRIRQPHKDHLTSQFGVFCADGAAAHSACTAVGLERAVRALSHTHGDDRANWPAPTEESPS